MKPLLRTKRLRISPMTDGALRSLRERETDPQNKQAYGDMLHESMKHPAQREWYTAWQINRKDGMVVGDLCFKGPPVDGEVEIGYGILPGEQGKGYATEAVGAAVRWAMRRTSVYFVTAETEPGNQKSQRVLQKLGFRRYGVGMEGPRFEKEKPAVNRMWRCSLLGLAGGVWIGIAIHDLALCSAVGFCAGAALGLILNRRERTALEKLRKDRMITHDGSPTF